ncbi:MAG: S-layer homology domain-containing protein, partial [Lachnospiraceae bacterium]|nr:S-layer homology domain-containing protein [Lachnospiraceae bacterium]
ATLTELGQTYYATGTIGSFQNTAITSVKFEDSEDESQQLRIGTDTFFGCSKLTSVEIPGKVTAIGQKAFYNDISLESIIFTGDYPASETGIVYNCFCDTITNAYYPFTNETWTSDKLKDYGGSITWLPGRPGDILISFSYFPDPVFRNYILENVDTDKDQLLSKEEREAVTEFVFTDDTLRLIQSLSGIEYFGELEKLETTCAVTRLNLSANRKLESVSCLGGYLESLVLGSQPDLLTLDCSGNSLETLVVSGCTALTSLDCHGNFLTGLDLTQNTRLESLDCSANRLIYLDLSSTGALTQENAEYSGQYPQAMIEYGTDLGYYFDLDDVVGSSHYSKFSVDSVTGISGSTVSYTIDDGHVLTVMAEQPDYADYSYQVADSGFDPMTGNLNLVLETGCFVDGISFSYNLDNFARYGNTSVYHPTLSYLMMALADAAYDADNIKAAHESLGMTNYRTFRFNTMSLDMPGFMISSKTLDDGTKLVLITIRGTSGEITDFGPEWQADFLGAIPGLGGPATNSFFDVWAEQIYHTLSNQNYITDGAKYFVTGHSRGAGAGNLLVKKMIDGGIPKDDIFDYNFACPDTAADYGNKWNPDGKYSCIFNIENAIDPITFIPGILGDIVGAFLKAGASDKVQLIGSSIYNLTQGGLAWGKYGNTKWFSSDWNNLDKAYLTLADLNPENDVPGFAEGHVQGNYIDLMSTLPLYTSGKNYVELKANHLAVMGDTLGKGFAQLFSVQCPVDIIVRAEDGTPVASVIGGEVNYYDSEFGEVIILVSGDRKLIVVNGDDKYTAELTGTEEGEMTFSVATLDYSINEIVSEKDYTDVEITEEKNMKAETGGDIASEDTILYVIGEEDQPIAEVGEDGTETPIECPVSGVSVDNESLDIVIGGTARINALVRPSNAANTNLVWTSSDPSIAEVDENGAVTVHKTGTVLITATTEEGGFTASCRVRGLFLDVTNPNVFWYEPVYWGTENGIVNGYANAAGIYTTFRPANQCTRQQMVTFLWRIAGEPEPESQVSPFSDVKLNKDGSKPYYYDAVLWAADQGIAQGYSDGTFKPTGNCLRRQAVMFMWRMAGMPEEDYSGLDEFADVPQYNKNGSENIWYKPVMWAAKHGITTGVVGADSYIFNEGGNCLRRQMVTFLWRYNEYVIKPGD